MAIAYLVWVTRGKAVDSAFYDALESCVERDGKSKKFVIERSELVAESESDEGVHLCVISRAE